MSELLALGLSHKTAPLELRERLALTEGRAAGVMGELTDSGQVTEAVIVSTCNRTELYLVVNDAVEAESNALSLLSRQADIRPTELIAHLYSLGSSDAARHLFQVTAGLDSMIVGEAEIQGQVKRAYELSLVEGSTGPILNRLFRGALSAGGRVRSETKVGEKGVSVPSVAIEMARRTLQDLSTARALVIGAGETAELVARALVNRGSETVFIANRHYDRAIGLADRFGGEAVRIDDLPAQLSEADIVISATNSPHHLVEREELADVMVARSGRPIFLVDLAVPRDIDPACREIPGVTVSNVDDIQAIVERNTNGRESEALGAREIIEVELERFDRWLASLEVLPTVIALRRHADQIVERVLAENEHRWEALTNADRQRMEMMAYAVAGRMLHEPTLKLKESAGAEESYENVNALRSLFGLGVDEIETGAEAETEAEPQATVTPIRRKSAGG
ncbi:MAG: glutamyl-tRNA reductase [Solirubrobacterales bacterium]